MGFGVFVADLVRQELRKHGIRIILPGQPFQALVQLLEANGKVVTREELRNTLWPDQPWGDHDQRLNSIVNKIREALCDSADTPRFLETLPRVGYRFLVLPEQIREAVAEEEFAAARLAEPLPAPATMIPVVLPAGSSQRPRRSAFWPLIAAIVALLLTGAAFRYQLFAIRVPAYNSIATPLTTSVGSELYPSFSPNGQEVVFAADGDQDSTLHLYITSVTGGGARRLTEAAQNETAPIWAPDGKRIAFLRESGEGRSEVWLVRPDGSQARKLTEIRRAETDHPLSWTKDSAWLVAAVGSSSGGPSALHLLSTETGEQRQITSAPMHFGGDLSPSVSPDGRRVAFTRATGFSWRDIFIVSLSVDMMPVEEPVRLTHLNQIIDTLAWTPDGRRLVFSSSTTGAGARRLFSVDVDIKGPAMQPVETGIEGLHPTISNGKMLAYARRNLEQSSVWRLDLDEPTGAPRQSRLISSTRRDYTVDVSPDGQRLVFSSVRSGPSEIWTSHVDGTDLRRITSLGASTPRWSPDGRRIAFESNTRGQPDIYVFDLSDNSLRRVSSAAGRNLRPSWSRDGKYIYFGSTCTGKSQIWKVAASGGQPVQITRQGGTYAIEAFDGQTLFYTLPGKPSAVWTAPVNGGEETPVITNVVGRSAIAMARDGLYYLSSATRKGAQLDFYEFQTRTIRQLASIQQPVHDFLSSPPNGKSVLYTQVDRQDSDLMLVDSFR
ncbi:MAG: winged helix-turn-helix domain-containing protein [Bryobacteraceae bacterium]